MNLLLKGIDEVRNIHKEAAEYAGSFVICSYDPDISLFHVSLHRRIGFLLFSCTGEEFFYFK